MCKNCRLPDEEAGEIPAACVVMNPNAEESEADIMDFVASNVASYKKVRVLQFVDTIPKSPSGKIMRRILKEKMIENMGKKVQPPKLEFVTYMSLNSESYLISILWKEMHPTLINIKMLSLSLWGF